MLILLCDRPNRIHLRNQVFTLVWTNAARLLAAMRLDPLHTELIQVLRCHDHIGGEIVFLVLNVNHEEIEEEGSLNNSCHYFDEKLGGADWIHEVAIKPVDQVQRTVCSQAKDVVTSEVLHDFLALEKHLRRVQSQQRTSADHKLTSCGMMATASR